MPKKKKKTAKRPAAKKLPPPAQPIDPRLIYTTSLLAEILNMDREYTAKLPDFPTNLE